jgi:4-hydroxy-2-oxoheptanedioate aldolase
MSKKSLGMLLLTPISQCNAETCSTPGINGLFVGSADLRMSLELKGVAGTEPEFVDALTKVGHAAQKNNIKCGAWVPDSAAMERYRKLGFSWFAIGSDGALLTAGAKQLLDSARSSKI